LNILDTVNSVFASYDLTTSTGPVSGQAFLNTNDPIPTTAGNFILTDVPGDSTFTATLGGPGPSPNIPTLSEWVMVGLPLLLAGIAVWRLRRRSLARG